MARRNPIQLALIPRTCAYEPCGKDLPVWIKAGKTRTLNNQKFCNPQCAGMARRGKARGKPDQQAKNHTRILKDGKRVYLHRDIFEREVRPLNEGEIVHHINDNKFDNRADNFEALTQSEHIKRHYENGDGIYRGRNVGARLVSDPDCPF